MNNLLTFTKKQSIGIFVVLIIFFGLMAFPYFIGTRPEPVPVTDTAWLAAANALSMKDSLNNGFSNFGSYGGATDQSGRRYEAGAPAGPLFNFDPNTLDAAGFQKLGLRDRTIQTLMNYRSKGGRFRQPEDLAKIYGLRPDEFERLKPYVVITGTGGNRSYAENNFSGGYNKPQQSRMHVIDINSADTTAWKSLYGIGSKLSERIVNFRTKLGGFYSVDQVGETYGVPDSTFQKIKPFLKYSEGTVRKLNINSASYDELNAHPYISGKLAALVVKQRKQLKITDAEQLKELVGQTSDKFEQVLRYISFE